MRRRYQVLGQVDPRAMKITLTAEMAHPIPTMLFGRYSANHILPSDFEQPLAHAHIAAQTITLLRALWSSYICLRQVSPCTSLLRTPFATGYSFLSGDQDLGVGTAGHTEAIFSGEERKEVVRVVEGGGRRRNLRKTLSIFICTAFSLCLPLSIPSSLLSLVFSSLHCHVSYVSNQLIPLSYVFVTIPDSVFHPLRPSNFRNLYHFLN